MRASARSLSMDAAPAGPATHAMAHRSTQTLPESANAGVEKFTGRTTLHASTDDTSWQISARWGAGDRRRLRCGLPRALEQHRRPGELLVPLAPPDLRGHGD